MSSYYKILGNTAHIISFVNISIFALALAVANDSSSLFDASWQSNGFCVINKQIPYWNSHDLCLYYDALVSLVLGVVYLIVKNKDGMKKMNEIMFPQIFGILFHGFGHGNIARVIRKEMVMEDEDDASNMEPESMNNEMDLISLIKSNSLMFFFYFFLLKASANKISSWKLLSIMALISQSIGSQINRQYAFTYVQTILMVVYHIDQLFFSTEKEKNCFEYMIVPIIMGLPVGFIGWMESTQCSSPSGVMEYLGGHFIYDAYIASSTLLVYLICWVRVNYNNSVPVSIQVEDKLKES